MICEQAIVEKGTENVSLINCFTRKRVEGFPSPPQSFSIAVFLTDGLGSIPLEVAIVDLESMDEIKSLAVTINFVDRSKEIRLVFRIADLVFPHAGAYDIKLFARVHMLAQHRFQVE